MSTRSLLRRTETAAAGGCQLDITLYSEALADMPMLLLFPVNALRSAALLAAATPLVMMSDADLLVGASLNAVLADPAGCVLPFSISTPPLPLLPHAPHPHHWGYMRQTCSSRW